MEINSEAKKVIYQYAEIIDSRNFDKLDYIMWSDFSMSGGYDLEGIEGFMVAMNYLVTTYDSTMHFLEILKVPGMAIFIMVKLIVSLVICLLRTARAKRWTWELFMKTSLREGARK